MKTVLVIGAAGDVGRGIVSEAIKAKWQVVAAGRSADKLASLSKKHSGSTITTVAGDITTEKGAQQLWEDVLACYGGINAVVISVNSAIANSRILEWNADELLNIYQQNVLTHFIAAKCFISKLGKEDIFIGIGGGTADFIAPKMAHLSMAQAALRMMYRGIEKENRKNENSPHIKELMIISMVNGESSRKVAEPSWLTDTDIGQHTCAILNEPARFPKAILTLSSREQIGES